MSRHRCGIAAASARMPPGLTHQICHCPYFLYIAPKNAVTTRRFASKEHKDHSKEHKKHSVFPSKERRDYSKEHKKHSVFASK